MRARRVCIRFLVTLWALAFGEGGFAQPEAAEPTFRFRVMGFGDGFFEGLRFEAAKGETQELEFRADRRSRVYSVFRDAGEIEFFLEEADGRGRLQRVPQARVRIEEGVTVALIVFLGEGVASPSRELPYRTLVLDESKGAFGSGDIRLLNLTSAPLDARLGEGSLWLEPRSASLARFDGDSPQPVNFSLYVEAGPQRRLVCSTRLMPDPLYGLLYVIKPPREQGSLRVRLEKLW